MECSTTDPAMRQRTAGSGDTISTPAACGTRLTAPEPNRARGRERVAAAGAQPGPAALPDAGAELIRVASAVGRRLDATSGVDSRRPALFAALPVAALSRALRLARSFAAGAGGVALSCGPSLEPRGSVRRLRGASRWRRLCFRTASTEHSGVARNGDPQRDRRGRGAVSGTSHASHRARRAARDRGARSCGANDAPDNRLAASAVGDVGLRDLERGAGQTAVDPGGNRLGVETRVRHAPAGGALSDCRSNRSIDWSRSREPFTASSSQLERSSADSLRLGCRRTHVEHVAQIQRPRVLGDAFETLARSPRRSSPCSTRS